MRRPETILEIRKKATFLEVINKPIICKFSKDFTNHRKKTNKEVAFSRKPLTGILKPGLQMRPCKNLEEKIPFLLKSSASMHENSGSQFFRTTTEIQSGPEAFEESRLVITFLTNLGVILTLRSFRLVLEWKAGKNT